MADEKRERRPQRRQAEDDGLIKKLIEVNRVTKVVKGGKNMRFAALVLVGDGKGKIGVATGKAKEVPEAIEKATLRAKKNMVSVSIVDGTIPHTVVGKFGRGAVLMMPASEGTGVIAGGPVRAVMEAVGIKNIRTKSHGSQNSGNCVKAAIEGLKERIFLRPSAATVPFTDATCPIVLFTSVTLILAMSYSSVSQLKISSTVLPRSAATCSAVLSSFKPSIAAFTQLPEFWLP